MAGAVTTTEPVLGVGMVANPNTAFAVHNSASMVLVAWVKRALEVGLETVVAR
jgi:hypothetical protein